VRTAIGEPDFIAMLRDQAGAVRVHHVSISTTGIGRRNTSPPFALDLITRCRVRSHLNSAPGSGSAPPGAGPAALRRRTESAGPRWSSAPSPPSTVRWRTSTRSRSQVVPKSVLKNVAGAFAELLNSPGSATRPARFGASPRAGCG
jgi:hypothetical protein